MPVKRDMRPVLLVLASTYPRWSNDHEPGFVHELAKRLTSRFRVLALVPHAPGALPRETLDGVEVIRYRYAPKRLETLVNDGGIVVNLKRSKWKFLLVPGFVFAQAWGAWRLARREKLGAIHAHWLFPQGWIAAILQLTPGSKPPFIVTSHGADLYAMKGGFLNSMKRFVIRRASEVTVVSGAMRQELMALGAPEAKISVLPMGVDMAQRFTHEPNTDRSAREILFVGRLVEKKGVCHLLDAMPAVLRRFPDASLIIAGFGPDESALKAQTQALGLEGSVRYLGAVPQSELPALYRRAALLVAPFVRARSGDEEGLGLVLIEAIGCGCPILAGRVPALAEILGVGFDDMTTNPWDAQIMAHQIVRLLNDPVGTRTRAEQLREALGRRFDWDSVADQYSQLLSTLN